MKKITILSKLKVWQQYCQTFSCRFKAGFSGFFETSRFTKRLVFYATLLLLGIVFTTNTYGQLVGEGAVKANFGVEADAYANFIGFSIISPNYTPPPPPGPGTDFLNTDDWFEKKSGLPVFWPGSGKGVIDQSNLGILASDPAGTVPYDLGNIMQNIMDNNNYSFEKRQSLTAADSGSNPDVKDVIAGFPVVETNGVNYLWLDAVYGRDYNVVGITGDAADKTWFTSGADKNADNPSSWTLGVGAGGPQKDDIIDVMAHLRGTEPQAPENPELDDRPFEELWAFAAATLRSTSGSKHIDFEFFRTLATIENNKIVNTGPVEQGGRNAFTFRTEVGPQGEFVGSVLDPGCILVSIDYSGGGRSPGVEIRVWMEESVFNSFDNNAPDRPFNVVAGTFVKGTDSGNFGYVQIAEKDPGVAGDESIFGRVNVEGSTLGTPWGTLEGPKADFSSEYLTLQHVEIGINLTTYGLDRRGSENPCANVLGSLLVKTRSSGGSVTSELKDFSGPYQFGFVIPPPEPAVKNLTACDAGSGTATFDLNNGVTNNGGGNISFHLSQDDAEKGLNALLSPDAYPSGDDTIYVRSVLPGSLCAAVVSFDITVNTVTLAASHTNVSCNGEADGTLTVDSFSGTGTPTFYLKKDAGAFVE
ncbi:hypothetical protein CXF59_08705, partial [Flavobacterium sp. ALD4]|uniref:hypothetical protein n=1 Tax=Flavobacterium sp. ALD4 TaxID=2058314 RepID=UPI000CC1966A